MNNQYGTLSEATNDLNSKGFEEQFTVWDDGKLHAKSGSSYNEHDVTLIEFHRFEGMSSPADSTIVYALKTNDGLKGTLVDSYGADSSENISKFMKGISTHFEE